MSDRNAAGVPLSVRTRLTLDGFGDGTIAKTVHCPRRERAVPYGICATCEDALALPVHVLDQGAEVRCRAGVPAPSPRADVAECAARTSVGEVMRGRIVCVDAKTPRDTLERLLLDEGARAVAVVGPCAKAIGLVTAADLWREGGESWARSAAAELMTPVVDAVSESAPLSFALAVLATAEVDHVLVVADSGELVGLFSARDAVRWTAEKLGYVVPPPGA